ncbi:hypothetical protein [Sinosporangium siamense]|uniref:Uncharacterized protein n=1 Tax=Sinosporangium siamense TaxID=1367973 RepID=A0A919RJF4_9ACTN|nr:hypothetical protein [Sinosporangium siamense]GII93464.1 hypothetical protein Ssi02_36950 [Sinosporangium siamense]
MRLFTIITATSALLAGGMFVLAPAVAAEAPRTAHHITRPADSTPAAGEGWRVVLSGRRTLGAFADVGAVSPTDAWITRTGLPLLRWNGQAWGPDPNPPAEGAVPYLVRATGAGDEWQFLESTSSVDVRHWNGITWTRRAINVEGAHATDAAIAGDETWVSGLRLGAAGMTDVLWRWDGAKWRTVEPPRPVSTLAAVSEKDVWALSSPGERNLGYDGERLPAAMHWDGRRWSVVPLPVLAPDEGTHAELNDLAVLDRDRVYAVGTVTSYDEAGRVNRQGLVLRWDGRVWTRLPHRTTGVAYIQAVSDGRGGLWLAEEGSVGLTHLSAAGRWLRVTLPLPKGGEVRALANVPGTTKMWATVQSGGRQLVLSYG